MEFFSFVSLFLGHGNSVALPCLAGLKYTFFFRCSVVPFFPGGFLPGNFGRCSVEDVVPLLVKIAVLFRFSNFPPYLDLPIDLDDRFIDPSFRWGSWRGS